MFQVRSSSWSRGVPGHILVPVVSSRGGPGHISVISLVGGLWVHADQRGAAGAAPFCCMATPVDGAGGCTGVHAAGLRGVHAGDETVAGATGTVAGTAGIECIGVAQGSSGVAEAMLLVEESSSQVASGCHS